MHTKKRERERNKEVWDRSHTSISTGFVLFTAYETTFYFTIHERSPDSCDALGISKITLKDWPLPGPSASSCRSSKRNSAQYMVGFNNYTLDEKKQRELAQIGSAQAFKNFSGAFHKIPLIATIVHESFQKPGNNPVLHFTQGHNGNHNHLYQSSPPLPSSSSFFSSSSSPFPYPSFFICICVNICARVCMWRKEVLIMCSYQWLYFFFLRQCLSLNTELTDFTRLAVHHVPRIPLSPHSTLHSQHWGDRSLPQSYMIFFEGWLLRIELGSSCLLHRPFIDWDLPPASRTPTSWQLQFQ